MSVTGGRRWTWRSGVRGKRAPDLPLTKGEKVTAHLHSTLVDGCYRCELGKDEEAAAIADRRELIVATLHANLGSVVERDVCESAADLVIFVLDREGYL